MVQDEQLKNRVVIFYSVGDFSVFDSFETCCGAQLPLIKRLGRDPLPGINLLEPELLFFLILARPVYKM
jgi:hypothetical protein